MKKHVAFGFFFLSKRNFPPNAAFLQKGAQWLMKIAPLLYDPGQSLLAFDSEMLVPLVKWVGQ